MSTGTEQDKQESNDDSKNTKEDDVSEKSSDVDSESVARSPGSEEKDAISLDALSQDELQYIVENSNYRSILSDLLSPFIEESTSETASVQLTENRSEQESRTTVHRLLGRQGGGADTSPSIAKRGALKRPSDESSSQPKKRQRLETRKRKSETTALTPLAKKSKTSSSASESEDESFDPTLEWEDKDDFKVKVPRPIEKYFDKHFRRSLSKEERTAMLKRHPKPDVDAAVPPKLDSFAADFALDKARDSQLSKIQGAMLYTASPLTNLWAELIEQGLANDPEAAIHVSDVLEIVQRSLVLLGNANSLISETRRENALESIHPSLRKYGKGEFTKAKADLFGQDFKETLVKKVEADSALSKAVNIVSKSAGSTSKVYQKPSGSRFFGSWTSRYGAVSGKVYQPYNRYQGKGKHTPNKPFYRKGSVFDRLGSNQSDRNPSNSQQNK